MGRSRPSHRERLDELLVKAASTVAPDRVRPPFAVDGRLVALAAVMVAVLLATVARASPTAFALIAAAAAAVVGYAATRWPLHTLAVAGLLTVVDLEITPRLLPQVFDGSPIGLSEPVLAIAGLGIAVGALRRGTFLSAFRDPVLPLVALFIGLAALSAVVNATPPTVALLGILMTVDALAIYFTVRMVPLEARAGAAVIAAIVVAVVAAAVFGLGQAAFGPDLFGFPSERGNHGEGARITSIFGNPNMLAAAIGLAFPFVLLGSLRLEPARWRWVARVALFLLACALLLTFSRGAWLAVGLGGLIGGLLVDWRAVPVLFVTVALAWGAVTVMPRAAVPDVARTADAQADRGEDRNAGDGGGGRGTDRADRGAATEGGTGDGPAVETDGPNIIDTTLERLRALGTRARYLREGLPILLDHPFLGVGPGRYGGAAATIIPSPVYEEYGTKLYGYRTVHNFWLHLLGEAGALGTAVFLTLIAGLVIRFVRVARAATGLRFVIVGGAAIMLLVATFHSVAEMIFEGNMPVLIVWLIAGIASILAPAVPLIRPRAPTEPA
jgi:O-antigen ligase